MWGTEHWRSPSFPADRREGTEEVCAALHFHFFRLLVRIVTLPFHFFRSLRIGILWWWWCSQYLKSCQLLLVHFFHPVGIGNLWWWWCDGVDDANDNDVNDDDDQDTDKVMHNVSVSFESNQMGLCLPNLFQREWYPSTHSFFIS